MIYAVANQPFEALAIGAPPDYVGTITVEVFDPTDGSSILPPQTAGITEPRSGTYVATLTVPTAGSYAVLWDAAGVTAVEELAVAASTAPSPPPSPDGDIHPPLDPPVSEGAHYFTLEQLRAEQDIPEASYPDEAVEPNRALAEEVLEHNCGAAFVPRWRTERLLRGGAGGYRLSAPLVRGVASLSIEGEPWAGPLYIDGNYLTGFDVAPHSEVVVVYAHGYERPPARVRRAAMIATRVWTTRGPVDDRATQIAADGATINLSTPGLLGSITGIPDVDETIRSYWRPGALY